MSKKLFLRISILVYFLFASFFCFAKDGKTAVSRQNNSVPRRIVSLAPNGTEILFELGCGSAVVARTDFCNYPNEVLSIPSVGGFDGKSFSIETILSYNPDFVYLVDGMHNHIESQLKQFGIRCYFSKAVSIESIFVEIQEVASIMGCEKNGKKLVAQLKNSLKSITVRKNPENVKVYCEIFSSPYMSIGKNTFMNDVIEAAGGKNIFDDLKQSYPQVSEEAIITKNPDIIIVPYYSTLQIESMYERIGWQSVNAVKNRKIFPIDEDVFSRPGPRVVQAIQMVQDIIWGSE